MQIQKKWRVFHDSLSQRQLQDKWEEYWKLKDIKNGANIVHPIAVFD